jgi:uncharacterized protein (DUF488 family)
MLRVTSQPGARLLTIGYEGRTLDELLATLRQAGVAKIADVRQLPISRKPGFSKSALAALLTSCGIEYVGFPKLGTPPAIRGRYKKTGDFARLRQDYLAHLGSQRSAIEELRELAAKGGCALLCFERNPAKCHRSILAEVLVARTGSAFRAEHLGFRGDALQGDMSGFERGVTQST